MSHCSLSGSVISDLGWLWNANQFAQLHNKLFHLIRLLAISTTVPTYSYVDSNNKSIEDYSKEYNAAKEADKRFELAMEQANKKFKRS